MRKYILILLLIGCLALPSNAGMVIQTVATAGGDTYDVGNIFSERYGTTGSDGRDNALTGSNSEGAPTVSADDQTMSEVGLNVDSLTVSDDGTYQYQEYISFASAGVVYGRLFFYLDSESWGNDTYEGMFALDDGGHSAQAGSGANTMHIAIAQTSGGQLQVGCIFGGGASFTTGEEYSNISIDTPYRLEFRYDNSGGAGSAIMTWWLDDVSVALPETPTQIGTRSNTTLLNVTEVVIGISYKDAASHLRFDTIDLDSTGRIIDE